MKLGLAIVDREINGEGRPGTEPPMASRMRVRKEWRVVN